MKNFEPKEGSKPVYNSKNGIKLVDGFFWIEYCNTNLISICSIHNNKNEVYLHGDSKPLTIESFITSELKGEIRIVCFIEFPE